MIEKVTLGTMTMNAGLGIPGSTIRWALANQFRQFKQVIVVDGHLTEEAKEFYGQFGNVKVIDSPWRDSYVTQYKKFADELQHNSYGLWLDDDEICSNELLQALDSVPKIDKDIIKIPCILHLTEDGKGYFPAEPAPKEEFSGQWTKSIIFRKNGSLDFRHFGSHVIPFSKFGPRAEVYLPKAYYHMKTLESFVYNDVWQAYLSPEGQQYTPAEAAKFKMFISEYKTSKDFKKATKEGTWNPILKKFAWERRAEYNRPVSRLAWVYFILEGHSPPADDPDMNWTNVKQYVLSPESMKIYADAKASGTGIVLDDNTGSQV